MNLSNRIGALETRAPQLSEIVIVSAPGVFRMHIVEQSSGETDEQFKARVEELQRSGRGA